MRLEELAIGDEVKVYERGKRGPKKREISGYFRVCGGKIIDLQPAYILVDTGKYRTRFDIIEFRTRRYRLLKASGEEIEFDPLPDLVAMERDETAKRIEEYHAQKLMGGEDNMGKPKITREELLQYVKEYGTDKRAIRDIAKKVGLQAGTISFYLYNWGILQQLKNEQEAAKDPAPAEEAKEEKDKGLPEPEPVPADLSRIEDEEQLARDREAVKEVTAAGNDVVSGAITYESIHKVHEETFATDGSTHIDGPYVCAYKGCTTLINTGVFCAKHQAIIPVTAATVTPVQRRILRPVNMMGEVTGCTYIFNEDSFRIDGEARFRYEDIDGLIEELLAIKNMRSA